MLYDWMLVHPTVAPGRLGRQPVTYCLYRLLVIVARRSAGGPGGAGRLPERDRLPLGFTMHFMPGKTLSKRR